MSSSGLGERKAAVDNHPERSFRRLANEALDVDMDAVGRDFGGEQDSGKRTAAADKGACIHLGGGRPAAPINDTRPR